ncbi:MAG: hypothetical protein II305_02675 [Clostridia bacterium]|nr:hypothetical protein [Clostridia bacterium]
MRKFLEKRVLPVVAAVCLLVTMVAVAISFASATEYTGKEVTLVVYGSDLKDNGYHLTVNVDQVYKGDKIKTNGNWLNFALNYTDGETSKSSKINGMQNWYCDGEWKFSSQLYYGKINGSSNNDAVTLNQLGTWKCVTNMEGGGQVTLIQFEVTEYVAPPSSEAPSEAESEDTSSDTSSEVESEEIDFGSENPAVDYSPRIIKFWPKQGPESSYVTSKANPSNLAGFSTDTVTINGEEYAAFMVGDTLKNETWWRDHNQYSYVSGDKTYTGFIYHVNLYHKDGTKYYFKAGTGEGSMVFEKPGEYVLKGTLEGYNNGARQDREIEIARFYVFWPTQNIIDQLVDISQDGGSFYYEKQRVNLVVNDTTGTMCDYVGVDVADIHVSDSLYIDTIWSNYLFEYRIGKVTYQGTVDKVYLYGVEGNVSGYKQYVPGNMGENDHYTEPETGFGEYMDVNDPDIVGKKLFTFELTGTYAIYGEVVTASGVRQNIYMGSFKVTDTPTKATPNEKYHYENNHLYAYQPREIKYYIDDDSSYLGTHLTFDPEFNNVFYVSDKLVNGNYWSNNKFNYTDVYGKVHTGNIYNLSYVRVTETGTTQMGWAQVGYGHSTGYTGDPFVLTEPGLWMLIGQQIEDNENGRINNVVMATFTVFDLNEDDPRGTGDQFTDVSETLKWSGSFNKADFKGDRDSINASGYLYAKGDDLVSLQTVGHLKLGTIFNVVATYAKNVEEGGSDADQFVVNAGDLKLHVKKGALGTYEAQIIYRGTVLGTTYFTEDYKSAVGTYDIENKLGKITVYKDGTAIKWISETDGKEVTTFDISKDYYFNVADVSIGVAGAGSYIPYLRIKPVDPTVINVTKTISYEKFTKENWKGNVGSISDGKLVANGRDLPVLTSVAPYNLGTSFTVSSYLTRSNGFTNYYGEKYRLQVGDITLLVGSEKNGDSHCVAELYYRDVKLGTADRGNAGGYSISGLWSINFNNGIITITCKEAKDGKVNTMNFVSEATGNEVTSFLVDDYDFEKTRIHVGAAGNYGPDGTCYVNGVTISPGSGATGSTGSASGTSGSSTKTGDASASLYVILAVLVAAATVLVTVRKVRVA